MSRDLRPFGLAIAACLALTMVASATTARPVTIKATSAASTGSWTVYHHDNAHTGYDPTLSKVQTVTAGWTSATLDGELYAEPLVFGGRVYAATLNNTVYAIDQPTGITVWSKHLGTPQSSGWVCGNVSPQGIIGTPVIDAAANRIYAVALITGTTPTYHLFGLDLANSGNIVLDTVVSPANFDWKIQQERGALALANGYVYVPFGGRAGDCFDGSTPYYGWVVGAPTSGVGTPNAYRTPSSAESVWAAGGVVVDDTSHNVFFATGNAIPCSGASTSDSVVRTNPTLGSPTFFQPNDWQANWCAPDSDLGSASPVLISSNLMFTAGKHGGGFLLNPASLGGTNGQLFPSPTWYTQADVCLGSHSDATFGSFAYAAPFVYVECQSSSGGLGLVALNTNVSTPSFSVCNATCAAPNWHTGGTSTFGPPIVAGGAVFAIDTGGTGLYAYDATTGAQIYHSAGFAANHFVTPSEAGGAVFVPAGNVIKSFDMNFGCTGTPISTTYFNWFDKASPGMLNDNIHIVNPGASASAGCVTVSGLSGRWLECGRRAGNLCLAAARNDWWTGGGDCQLRPAGAGLATRAVLLLLQRGLGGERFVGGHHQLHQLVRQGIAWHAQRQHPPAQPGSHERDGNGEPARCDPQMATVAAGAEGFVSFPAGTIGGPVTISSTQPVLAAQRVQYYSSFNEVWAQSAAQASVTSYINWFDKASPGMMNDNIHMLNPGATSATVTVSLPGGAARVATVAPGAEGFVSFPAGTIGGPVTVSSTQPVLASQRVQYYASFNEVWAESAAQAATTSYINWFDKASPGMFNDNIHLLNPGATSATVTVSLPGAATRWRPWLRARRPL